jgi:hypothetical protein
MTALRIITLLAVVSIAGGCAGPYDKQASVPPSTPRPDATARNNCVDYGFTPGTASYDRCVQREAGARSYGRVGRDYSDARLIQDARDACFDYGLERGSRSYDVCLVREVDARRYRQTAG